MQTRREFLEFAASLTGGMSVLPSFLHTLERAAAIAPKEGSTYLDAEHVVILMQENRSFDHAYGSLRGVRGFNDPRAITLPDGNPVWVQTNKAGERFVPFRLDINATNATWMGSLPHGWNDQVDARNQGLYDKWLKVKSSSHRDYSAMPLTLGHYTREDIPFYYAFADAFTICDQYFCSSLTGTTPNRLYLWTGTIREKPTVLSPANVRNEEVDLDHFASWTTFPERLSEHDISWKVYQNELTVESGFSEIEDDWLANFGDNPLEYFTQYRVTWAENHRKYVELRLTQIPAEIEAVDRQLKAKDLPSAERTRLRRKKGGLVSTLERYRKESKEWNGRGIEALSPRERTLHERGLCTNLGDPLYRQVVEHKYRDGKEERKLFIPKGDLLHQFREDVRTKKLPTVSWLVAPKVFSDHPSSAWYGAWYIAEVINILIGNPEVWKKTIFLLMYDENDGYFDHVPPFVAPHPRKPETGKVSPGIDASLDFVEFNQDNKWNTALRSRESPIGLGYRVPMVIASPWSRGGAVCSQVFDHTSVLQFLETLLSHKHKKKIAEPNISAWRRTVCGDLTSAFRAEEKGATEKIPFPPRDRFLESIHRAKFKSPPGGFKPLTEAEIARIRKEGSRSKLFPGQEPGTKPSCPLPYELSADGALAEDRKSFRFRFEAANNIFRDKSVGSPFTVYAIHSKSKHPVRNYAVSAGSVLEDTWSLADFPDGKYHFRAYGPNGFYREFVGDSKDAAIEVNTSHRSTSNSVGAGSVEIIVKNDSDQSMTFVRKDNAYKTGEHSFAVPARQSIVIGFDMQESSGWYDFTLTSKDLPGYSRRFAGRVETGSWSISDPAMA